MRRKVITYNQVEGFNEYANAPKNCACLTGIFKNDFATRNEFLNIVRHER